MNSDDSIAESEIEDKPLIPEGIYKLAYVSHCVRRINNAGKLEIRFRILDEGSYKGLLISRYYNVTIIGDSNTSSSFKASKAGSAARELIEIIDFDRLDRIPVTKLSKYVLLGKVKTVTCGSDKTPIHEKLHYSVVGKLLGKDL